MKSNSLLWCLALTVVASLMSCATSQDTPTRTRPANSAEMLMGYQEAIEMGSTYAQTQGYSGAQFQGVELLYPNIWCVRFGLAPRHSHRLLELYFDGSARTLIKKSETDHVPLTFSKLPNN